MLAAAMSTESVQTASFIVMRALLRMHRSRSRRVCKPTRIVLRLARRLQRGRRQSASQRQQQVTMPLEDGFLHDAHSLYP